MLRRVVVCPVGAYFPDNHWRSIHYPLFNTTLSQQSWLRTLIQIRIVYGGGGDIKTGRETDIVVLSSFLIEGASFCIKMLNNEKRCPLCCRRSRCVRCVRETYKRTLTTFVNAIYTVHSDHMRGIDLFRLEIESDQKCPCKRS